MSMYDFFFVPDSCKFLHDRGDYKSGWQLDREFEENKGQTEGGWSRDITSRSCDSHMIPLLRHEAVRNQQ